MARTSPVLSWAAKAFLPRFRNLTKSDKRNFIKGYCMMISSGGGAAANMFAEYGEELQKKLDHYQGSCVSATIYGERVPRFENHVRINKSVNDAWGIPVLHVEAHDTDNERNQAKDAADTAEELFHAAGWDIISKTDKFYPPGYSIHEVGTCRMGDNPKTSVLNKWNQSHDIKNLYVVDGAAFATLRLAEPHHDNRLALHARIRTPRRANEEGRAVAVLLARIRVNSRLKSPARLRYRSQVGDHLHQFRPPDRLRYVSVHARRQGISRGRPAIACAVTATIGIRFPWNLSRARMLLVASNPSISGICKSISIRSKDSRSMAASASRPLLTTTVE